MEGAAADEQDVVRVHVAVLGRHDAALDDGQQVPLHALAAGIRTCDVTSMQSISLPSSPRRLHPC